MKMFGSKWVACDDRTRDPLGRRVAFGPFRSDREAGAFINGLRWMERRTLADPAVYDLEVLDDPGDRTRITPYPDHPEAEMVERTGPIGPTLIPDDSMPVGSFAWNNSPSGFAYGVRREPRSWIPDTVVRSVLRSVPTFTIEPGPRIVDIAPPPREKTKEPQ